MAEASRRVLLVEPDQALSDLICEYLRTRGLLVTAVGTAAAALMHLDSQEPDAVLVSEQLPDGAWTQLLVPLRLARRPLAMLVFSATPTVQAAVSALKDGAQDYLQKPLRLRELYSAIERAAAQVERSNLRVHGVLRLADSFQTAPMAAMRPLLTEMTQLLAQECGAVGALIAVREPELRRWVEMTRSNNRSFQMLNLERLGRSVEAEERLPDLSELWYGPDRPTLHVIPLRLRLNPRVPARPEGAIVLTGLDEPGASLRLTLRLYGAVTEQALTASALTVRVSRAENIPTAEPQSLQQRILSYLDPTMDAMLLSPTERALARSALALWLAGREAPEEGEHLDPLVNREELARVLAAVGERHDGRGSPQGLSARQIPAPAALVALGVWWALSTGGSAILPPLHSEEIRAELEARAGRQFSPAVVAAFLRTLSPDIRSADTIPPLGDDDLDDEATRLTPTPSSVWLSGG